MCGIYGEVRFGAELDLPAAVGRLQQLAHRGPDGWGIAAGSTDGAPLEVLHKPPSAPAVPGANIMLGHRRLAIIDLSELALQPMASHSGMQVMVFNGEIYNFAELRRELSDLGHTFRTDHSDSEALLHAYLEWGDAALDRLHGMFAFAIFDSERNQLFLARDRVGQKPLYFVQDETRFAFASELGPLIHFDDREASIDPTSLAQYLMLGYVPDPRSIFAGISRLPPAHCATLDISSGEFRTRCYWEPPLSDSAPAATDEVFSEESAEQATGEHWERAVRRRLVADVPIGAFISGGIDSTLVAKVVVASGARLEAAMSADFADASMSERKWVDQVEAAYGVEITHVMLDQDTAEAHEDVLSRLDEPFDGGSAISSHSLYGIAEGRVTVVLTGDGGDELFGGYTRYESFIRTGRLLKRLRALGFALPLLRLFLPLARFAKRYEAIRAFFHGDELGTYAARTSSPWMLDLLQNKPEVASLYDYVDREREKLRDLGVKAAQYLDFRTILPGRMLYKADRLSMSRGLEVRSPFMDHELIELAFRIPAEIHYADAGGKTLLRRLVAKDLGRAFVDRPKQGFGNPLRSWFQSPTGRTLLEDLEEESNPIYRYLDFEKTIQRYSQIRDGFSGEDAQELWRLVVLSSFLRRHRVTLGLA